MLSVIMGSEIALFDQIIAQFAFKVVIVKVDIRLHDRGETPISDYNRTCNNNNIATKYNCLIFFYAF